MQPRASQPDSAVLTQLQAQVNVLAVQLEAVGKQLALASEVAIDEQSRAQVWLQPATGAPTETCRACFDLRGVHCPCLLNPFTPAALAMCGSCLSVQTLYLYTKCLHY